MSELTEAQTQGRDCVKCGMPFSGAESLRGFGDGSGQLFVHNECYLENQLQQLTRDNQALRAALQTSITAIDDWLNSYASDQCDESRVAEAAQRIRAHGGTIAYIADLQQTNRAALADPSGAFERAIAEAKAEAYERCAHEVTTAPINKHKFERWAELARAAVRDA